jgi:hypothetical protein
MSVEDTARALGLSLSEVAWLVVSGELAVDVAVDVVALDVHTVRVSAVSVQQRLADRAAWSNSSLDRSEANRVLGRKYSRRNWPPKGCAPVRPWAVASLAESPVVEVPVIDYAGMVLKWINDMGEWQPRVSAMIEFFCVSTKWMSRANLEAALAELESLHVIQVVKARSGSRGPRPRVAQLLMWYHSLVRQGYGLSIAEVRARMEE